MTRSHAHAHRALKRRGVALAVLLVLCAGAVGGAALGASGENGESDSEAGNASERMVREVLANNIFSAERRRPEPEPEPEPEVEREPEPPPNPDASLVLVGVVIRNGSGHVFVEDRDTGSVQRVSVPGAFAQGEITEVHVDGVRYRVDGASSTISVQQSFAGEDVDTFADRGQRDGDDTSGGARPRRDASGGAQQGDREAILERMRRAREQQRNE